jgi:acyl-CoA thioesterase YciA
MNQLKKQNKYMNLVTKKIVMSKDIGIHGNLFGGILMAWLDEAAAAFASEYCYTPNLVTVKVGELVFKKPLKAGQHLRIYAEVVNLGTTSITLMLEARKYSVYSGEETIVASTNITMVRIDDDGTPTAIGEKAASLKRKHIAELFRDAGIPTKDTTMEHKGKTTLIFTSSPRKEQTDEAETYLHNLNRRKG